MSSISALWCSSSELPTGVLAEKMVGAQAIHGPNAHFLWSDGEVALGGNLLELLSEDRFDCQPLWAADRSVCLVADIRLDNRGDLVRELGLAGADEMADSTILLQAWMRWGEGCLDHIVGAFGFAVWMPGRQELFAARDHVGERPLYFHRGKDFFALASMPKGLLALPGVNAEPDEARMVDWMSINRPGQQSSFFAAIERVPPGHFVRVRPGRVECVGYWHPCDAKPVRYKRDSDYAEALVEILDRATEPRLRSIGEIGAQLSAGLDSSTVAACAARLLGGQGRRMAAYTSVPQAGFLGKGSPGRVIDEGAGAADMARMYPHIDHFTMDSAGYDLFAELEAWSAAMDEPPINVVNFLWISAILDAARARGVRVLMHGVYGNFTISQEGRDNLQTYLRKGRWVKLFRHANNLRVRGEMPFRRSFFYATNGLIPMGLKRRLRPGLRLLNLDGSALRPELKAQYRLLEREIEAAHADFPDIQTQRRAVFDRHDFGAWNAATIARYGIEQRDPTGDKRVFDFCYGIPPEQYAVGGQSRSLVRRAMRERLPESTLQRFARGQQGADWYLTVEKALPSLRAELARQEGSDAAGRMVDLPRLKMLAENWPASGYETGAVAESWNFALTRGVMLGHFLRTHERL